MRHDLICLCHLRWDSIYQRPQHLMSRFARERRVFFVDGLATSTGQASFAVGKREQGLWVATPHVPAGMSESDISATLRGFIDGLFATYDIHDYVLWYYTPMALGCTRHLLPGARAVIYDCMDELSLFADGLPAIKERELELFRHADLVFTGGPSLYEAKSRQHPHVYAFPSSVDAAHFAQARHTLPEPGDQVPIARPRIGYYGVLDERVDLDLLDAVATARPAWHLVMIGPVAKIDPRRLPHQANIHYLGAKAYRDLPAYLAGWEVAMMPFARNDATRFISPTKTLEYLAAGKAVVSTAIRDVVRPYGEQGLVQIADMPDEFVRAIEAALRMDAAAHIENVDRLLANLSWDRTWEGMARLVEGAGEGRGAN